LSALHFFPFNFFVALSNAQSPFALIVWAYHKRITDVINFQRFHYISVMMWLYTYTGLKGSCLLHFLALIMFITQTMPLLVSYVRV
jgi:hypothetical protein